MVELKPARVFVEKRTERCFVRVPVSLTDPSSGNLVLRAATTLNLSCGGSSVRGHPSAPPPPVGAKLRLEFRLPGHEQALAFASRVSWVNPDDRDLAGRQLLSMGLEFVEAPSEALRQVEEFVRSYRHVVLAVDDDMVSLELMERALRGRYRVLTATSADEAMAQLATEDVAVLLVDQRLPGRPGTELLEEVNRRYAHRPLVKIALTGASDTIVIRDFVNRGRIFHFLRKPVDMVELEAVIYAATETYSLMVENERLNSELLRTNEGLTAENRKLKEQVGGRALPNIIGSSRAVREVIERLRQVADTPTSVHVRGETGTGKELVARALHVASPRSTQPFVAFHCAGVPDTMIQSTLFGFRKGAFTGAEQDRKGVFEEATGGTVFLDEIGDISPTVQTSLLRVLQEGEVVRLGSTQPVPVDVRIISATHHDLREDVRQGRFREDLFYRLVVFELELPPLRQRLEDLPELVDYFLREVCREFHKGVAGISAACMEMLERHPWPGNVRELENEIKRAVVATPAGGMIDVPQLSAEIRAKAGSTHQQPTAPPALGGRPLADAMRDLEAHYIREAMRSSDGIISQAAKVLGMEQSTLRKKMKRLGM